MGRTHFVGVRPMVLFRIEPHRIRASCFPEADFMNEKLHLPLPGN